MATEVPWGDLIARRDAAALAAAIRQTFGLEVDPDRFLAACDAWKVSYRKDILGTLGRFSAEGQWSPASWTTWVRNRIADVGPEEYRPGCSPPPEILTGELNVGFVGVEETEAQVDRLRNPAEAILASRTARSKIGKTTKVIRPVDAVAERVAPVVPVEDIED